MEVSRLLLLSPNVPFMFWDKVVLTIIYLINCIPFTLTSGLFLLLHCMVLQWIILLYGFLSAFPLFCYLLMNTKIFVKSRMCVLLCYSVDKKKDISMVWKLIDYMFLGAVFLETIPFYSLCNTLPFPTFIDLLHYNTTRTTPVVPSTISSDSPSSITRVMHPKTSTEDIEDDLPSSSQGDFACVISISICWFYFIYFSSYSCSTILYSHLNTYTSLIHLSSIYSSDYCSFYHPYILSLNVHLL